MVKESIEVLGQTYAKKRGQAVRSRFPIKKIGRAPLSSFLQKSGNNILKTFALRDHTVEKIKKDNYENLHI